MDHHRWAQVDRLFHEALALSAPARAAYLRGAAGDDGVAHEVDRLLRMHDRAGAFLETADLRPTESPAAVNTEASFRPGDRIDRFRLVSLLGTGGMGEVWLAERFDRQFDQRVALKIVRPGRASSDALARFLDERQTLARLEHPAITRLIDGGATQDGRPYLVMELVEGAPIDRYILDHGLGLHERLRLFRSVCDAVQFAHQNLIVHRDLKPANVLVTLEGRPKLLDFGIAQLLDQSRGPDRGLTVEYASPEQMSGSKCTTASDVFSLGVLLRELVAPSTGSGRAGPITQLAAVQSGRSGPPVNPLPRKLGDLRFIIERAVQFAPERRYATAMALSDDIGRYIERRPVRACKVGVNYRARRFVTRNLLSCAITAAAILALVAGAVVTVQSWRRAAAERDTAEAANSFFEGVLASVSPFSLGHDPTVEDLLERTSQRAQAELSDRPEVEFRTRMTLIRAHVSLWNWEKVRKEARRALVLARQLHGPKSEQAATCLAVLGRAQTWAKDPAAIDTQRQALEIRRELYPPDHPAIAEILVTSGFAVWQTLRPPRPDRAEALYRQGIESYRRGGEVSSADYARAIFSFANFLHSQGDESAEVMDLVRESVEVFEQLDQPPDRYSTAALFMYGGSLIQRGQAGAGLLPLRKFVEQVPMEVSGTVPLDQAYWSIGLLERIGGERGRALDSIRRAVECECRARASAEDRPGPWFQAAVAAQSSTDVLSLWSALGPVVETMETSAKPDDAPFLEGLIALAAFVQDAKDVEVGERWVRRIHGISQSRLPKHPCMSHCADAALGYLASVDERFEEAENLLDRSFRGLRVERGDFAPLTQLALAERIRLAERRGALEKAEQLKRLAFNWGTPVGN